MDCLIIPRKKASIPARCMPIPEYTLDSSVFNKKSFYDTRKETTRDERKNSPIYFLRIENNNVKSKILKYMIDQLRRETHTLISSPQEGPQQSLRVFDPACGRGGDLFKMVKLGVTEYVGSDISENCINLAKERAATIASMKIELQVLDFLSPFGTWPASFKNKCQPESFHLINMQFCLQYFMTTPSQVMQWLSFLSSVLVQGGYWICTVPDYENQILPKIQNAFGLGPKSWKNKFASISHSPNRNNSDKYSWFRYHFNLVESVDDDESAVDVDYLSQMANHFQLKLIMKRPFSDFSGQRRIECLSSDELEIFNLYQILLFQKV